MRTSALDTSNPETIFDLRAMETSCHVDGDGGGRAAGTGEGDDAVRDRPRDGPSHKPWNPGERSPVVECCGGRAGVSREAAETGAPAQTPKGGTPREGGAALAKDG
ncbi:hypothetical protein GCM10017776_40490 [Streptomyces griseoluteus]|nr:hypothetical protein GCM10017776_40490 [Streptomyces griseoluteus]